MVSFAVLSGLFGEFVWFYIHAVDALSKEDIGPRR